MHIRTVGLWALLLVVTFPLAFILVAEILGPPICFLLGAREFEGQCGFIVVFFFSPIFSLGISAYFATHVTRHMIKK